MTNLDMEAFLEITKSGSISKAADHLFLSQPALSFRINNLEQTLGCKLFIRQKGVRNVELTEQGRQFIPMAERWIKLNDEMQNLGAASDTNPFRISAINSISSAILPDVYLNFLELWPNISLETDDLASYASYDAIEYRHKDLAVIVDQRYSLKALCRPLFSESIKFVCNIDLDLPETITVSQLNPLHYVYSPWFLEFEQWNQSNFGKNFRPHLQVQTIRHMDYFLSQKNYWSLVPATVARILTTNPKIVCRKLDADIPKRNAMYLVPHDRFENSALTDNFLQCCLTQLTKLQGLGLLECKLQ